jgi:MoaA/NifB/PqqE/SkfB family radical SAM enzyme
MIRPSLFYLFKFKVLGQRIPLSCSLAPTLACNLHCVHCYSATPRAKGDVQKELSIEDFRALCIRLRKRGIVHATLTDGEPLLNETSTEKCKVASEVFQETWLVTNGTHGFPIENKKLKYIISLDGSPETHDLIRGKTAFRQLKENVKKYRPRFFVNSTLNRHNHNEISEIIKTAQELQASGISFAWSTPMSRKDTLHLSHEERNKDISEILYLKSQGLDRFIMNSKDELEMMRNNDWSKDCPLRWFTESYDAYGNKKEDCVFGRVEDYQCGSCGCNIGPSVLVGLQNKESLLTKMLSED